MTQSNAPRPGNPRTEEELLDREDHEARLRLKAALEGMREDVLEATDLEGHVRRHPVTTLAAFAGAGFMISKPALKLALRHKAKAGKGIGPVVASILTKMIGASLLDNVQAGLSRPRGPRFP